jgi:hypothetical protein
MRIALFLVRFLLYVCSVGDPVRQYPLSRSRTGTSFLNHSSYLIGFDEPQ